MDELSIAEARAIAVSAQGLHPSTARPAGADPAEVIVRAGCVQVDTIAVVRRSHELVLLARGVADRAAAAVLDPRPEPVLFEYKAHALSLVPLALWPYFAFRRRRYLTDLRGVDPAVCREVRAAISAQGEATITELGGARGSGWYRGSPVRWALEWLLDTGELVCLGRRRFSRVYRLSHAALPADLLAPEPDDATCHRHLVGLALDRLGVATADDVADYFRIGVADARRHLQELDGAERVAVRGWPEPAWASADALRLPTPDPRACTPLSPFDPLVWHRPRLRRLFGVDYLLEAYKPPGQRECGYFGMPVLSGRDIVGRIALRTRDGAAEVEGQQLVDGYPAGRLRHAARVAARWAGASLVTTGV